MKNDQEVALRDEAAAIMARGIYGDFKQRPYSIGQALNILDMATIAREVGYKLKPADLAIERSAFLLLKNKFESKKRREQK